MLASYELFPLRQHGVMAKKLTPNYLRAWRHQSGLTVESVASRAGTDKGQLSKLENGERRLTVDWLSRIAPAYGVAPDKLLTPPASAENENSMREPPPARMLALIDSVKAGTWTEVVDPKEVSTEYVPAYRHVGPRAFALRIEGNSMLPDFRDGDIIIVDPDVRPAPGRFVVAKIDEDEATTFKKYRLKSGDRLARHSVELVPLNDDWPVLTIGKANPGRIVGVAVDHYRKLV